MADIQFIRNKKYGTMGTGKNGWTKEVCNVSWNQKAPKLDIREWSPDYQKMSRGITLTKQEAKRLLAILATIDFEEFDQLGAHPEAPMQVRPVYQNAMPQGQGMMAPAAVNYVQPAPAQTPVNTVQAPPVAQADTPISAPQTVVVTTPEIVSMSEENGIPDGFGDSETEEVAELQSMALPVAAI